MMKRFTGISLGVILVLAVAGMAAPGPAFADAAGGEVLLAVDGAIQKEKTLEIVYDGFISASGKGRSRNISFKLKRKGEKVLMEVLAPKTAMGMKLLVVSPAEIYSYSPTDSKTRRLSPEASKGSVLSMAFAFDDLQAATYASRYDATLGSAEDKGNPTLTLTAKADASAVYPKIEMTVEKGRSLPLRMEYYDAAGKKVRTETRSSYGCDGGACAAARIRMEDHTKEDITTLTSTRWKVNKEIADSLFMTENIAK
jgi:outer membrane lipoprotein-sorting protein